MSYVCIPSHLFILATKTCNERIQCVQSFDPMIRTFEFTDTMLVLGLPYPVNRLRDTCISPDSFELGPEYSADGSKSTAR